ncbi:stage II sporulation protein D [Cyclonatronum proteinivorum]|uniref:Stage II sporulation protein D n=2 Tax=Cyclonatronum proteinivorum TaxID=1457365 RepID=A0A345ULM7_9BACT|nr:stage II sporulation protein D [Cyclonatronum proteinivorum]
MSCSRSLHAQLFGLASMMAVIFWMTCCATLPEGDTQPPKPDPAEAEAQLKAAADRSDLIRLHGIFELYPLQRPAYGSSGEIADESATDPLADSDELPTHDISWNPIVRVNLFAMNPPQQLTLQAHEGNIAVQAAGRPAQLTAGPGEPLQLQADGNLVILQSGTRQTEAGQFDIHTEASGLVRAIHPEKPWRYYRGSLRIEARNNQLQLINYVTLEDYVSSVVGSEMNFMNPEALKVQAVISRTYAVWNSGRSTSAAGYDLNDSVLNQVYLGELITSPRFREAAYATSGEVLSWSGELILAAYHSTCGGQTAANETVWSGAPLPWLRGAEDFGSCSASPHFRWRFEVPAAELHELFNTNGIRVENGSGQDRASVVYLSKGSGYETIGANAFRLRFNQRYGTLALRSTHFRLEEDGETYIFEGRGLGHGIGLCQWGALGKAEAGWNYRDILRFYYNGADLSRLPEPQP